MHYKVVIPARANSERLPQKHMRLLGGKPLIQYSIDFALKNFSREDVWVNTNDPEVIMFAIGQGVNTLERPDRLAGAHTPSVEALQYQTKYFNQNDIPCDAIVLLQPTNPLRNEIIMKEILKLFESSERSSIATFSLMKKKFGRIERNFYTPVNYIPGQRSQDLKKSFSENGQLYITKVESIEKGEIVTEDVYPIICKDVESEVDIDCLVDLIFADSILKMKNEK
ncbi:acylneuraminate cytidylyltransferase family protein [Akkermansiaceae bacterium]|nr:acylneuraminate cytidylyltransferase family protein [Akkermansiaceae bacterium]